MGKNNKYNSNKKNIKYSNKTNNSKNITKNDNIKNITLSSKKTNLEKVNKKVEQTKRSTELNNRNLNNNKKNVSTKNKKTNMEKVNKKVEQINDFKNRTEKSNASEILVNNGIFEFNNVRDRVYHSRKENNKGKKYKKFLIVIFSSLLLVLIVMLIFFINEKHRENERIKKMNQELQLVEEIKSYYSKYVKTNKDAILYDVEGNEIGKIASDIELTLKDVIIDKNTKYFELNDFSGYFIKYQDIVKIDALSTYDGRHNKYIVFNENIITNDKTRFYDKDNRLVYELNTSYSIPIIIKDGDRYGVEFNSRLLYVKNEDIKEIIKSHNTDVHNSNGVLVLNYHAFYDETSLDETRGCPTVICHSKKQFKTHLDYIKENNILTLTMNEFEMYIDKKIQVPKSVLITIDDGGRVKHGIDMLTEYKMNATIFLVTSWFDPKEFYKTEYIELHSHTHSMHDTGDCPTGQGGGIQCLDRNIILDDLKTSRELLNNTTVFCYPFYEYNSYSINLLKEAGFTMAFAGGSGNLLVAPGSYKYTIPRYVVTTATNISELDYYFKQIKN